MAQAVLPGHRATGWMFLMSEVPLYGAGGASALHASDQHHGPFRRPLSPRLVPREVLRGGIRGSFLEPLARFWSHFVGIYCQKLTNLQ